MENQTWNYFLALEKDFIRTAEFVEPSSTNYSSYSNWYAKLLLLAGSEVDVVAKQICAGIQGSQNASNILEYQTAITGEFPGMHEFKVRVPRYSLVLMPWNSWANPKSPPQWWRDYNSVKHKRNANFTKANLENVLYSLAGLLTLELYYYQPYIPQPYPEFFDAGFPETIVTQASLSLPGAP